MFYHESAEGFKRGEGFYFLAGSTDSAGCSENLRFHGMKRHLYDKTGVIRM